MAKPTEDSDIAFVQAMADILRDNNLAELEVERRSKDEGKLTLRLSKTGRVQAAPPAPPPTPATPQPLAAHRPDTPEPAGSAGGGDPADHPGAVTSPMVGTVYLSPEPGAEVFVKIGDTVTEGQPLLIIEAMKTMNQIPSPRAGKVRRILVEDGSPVEYGAPLMVIE